MDRFSLLSREPRVGSKQLEAIPDFQSAQHIRQGAFAGIAKPQWLDSLVESAVRWNQVLFLTGEQAMNHTKATKRSFNRLAYNSNGAQPSTETLMAATDLVLALTGASGVPYGVRLLEVLLDAGRTIHLTISPAAVTVIQCELDRQVSLNDFRLDDLLGSRAKGAAAGLVRYHHFQDFQAGIASGSFLTAGMVICPCSMGSVAAIAHGLSQNLIHRAADVHLKERRRLILVPRETPLNVIQLRNLAACAEAGATVLPAMPPFYNRPRTLQDNIDFIVGRVCDQLGVEHGLLKRWGVETQFDEN
jgi:flavin prenyltransferase